MEQVKVLSEGRTTGQKKPYTKPVLSLVHLVASEAVLSLCKFGTGEGVRLLCAPDASCDIATARS